MAETNAPGPGSSNSSNSEARSSVSFTFQKRTDPPKVNLAVEKEETKDYVLSLVGKKIKSTKPLPQEKEFVVPLIAKNKWKLPSGAKVAGKEEGKGNVKSEQELQLDREAAAAVLKDIHDAELRHQDDKGEESDHMIPLCLQNKPPVVEGREGDEMADVELRPDPSNVEDYDDMPVERLGKAMLLGMGWKVGRSVGKNSGEEGLVQPIEFLARPRGLGLGAVSRPAEPPKKKKIRKPGEEVRKVQGPYVDKEGRVKHVKKIDDSIPEQPLKGYVAGNYARVMVGPHEDLYGKIHSVEEKSNHLMLKMAINDQVLRFSRHHVDLVSREEYSLGRPLEGEELETEEQSSGHEAQPKKEFGLILKRQRPDDVKSSMDRPKEKKLKSMDSNIVKGHGNRSFKKEDQTSRKPNGNQGDIHRRGDSHHKDNHRHGYRTQEHPSVHDNDGSSLETAEDRLHAHVTTSRQDKPLMVAKPSRVRREDQWLWSNLRVKMVDRVYKKGRHYNTKMVIVDVVSMGVCVCQAEDGKLLEGVTQDMLETVVPRTPLPVVRVVRGANKNKLATVVVQDRARAEAVIQLNLSKEVASVDFDDICEYVGETDVEDYLG